MAAAQQTLSASWDDHVKYEFATRNTDDTLETMVADSYVNHVPVMTGGVGHEELREFYSKRFIPQMPPDTAMTPVSRTIGVDRIVDEMVFEFTHTSKMDWMLPGVEPTGKHVKVALVVIVHFRDGKLGTSTSTGTRRLCCPARVDRFNEASGRWCREGGEGTESKKEDSNHGYNMDKQ